MKTYQIITDSSCDLPQEILDQNDILVAPLTLHIDGETYRNMPDGSDISFEEFFRRLRSGAYVTTSAVNPEVFTELFESVLQKGLDILYLGFSSALSCTYQNACIAASALAEKYPDRTILTIDSLCASLGQGLLCYLVAKKQQEGVSLTECAGYTRATIPHLCHWFTVDDLHHLRRGGRISGAAAFFGTALHIKPYMHTDDNGKLVPVGKVRGRKAALETLLQKMGELGENLTEQTVFICQGDCLADAEYVAAEMKKRYGVKEVIINYVGPVIAAHTGCDVLSIFFLGVHR